VRAPRDWIWLEVLALLCVLVAGAGLRYWLSTAIPLDSSEFAALSQASVRDHGMRVPFIMLNGASLFALYLLVRRAAGIEAAFALLLLLQTSPTFQEHALRIRLWTAAFLPVLVGVTLWRYGRPARHAPIVVARALLVVALLLGLRGVHLGLTLPGRIDAIRQAATADPDALYASLVACGAGAITPLPQLRGCQIAWPPSRSLEQQEALLRHAQRMGANAVVLDGSAPLPRPDEAQVAVFDRSAVALFAVAEGPMVATAARIVR
jgi:hypothetical protein